MLRLRNAERSYVPPDTPRRSDKPEQRVRIDTGHIITIMIAFVSAISIGVGSWFAQEQRVASAHEDLRHIEERVKSLEDSKQSKERADGDMKQVLTKLEEMDKRLSERLDRIDRNRTN